MNQPVIPEGSAPTGQDFALASSATQAVGAIADGVVIGLVTYVIAESAGLKPPAGVRHLNVFVSSTWP